MTELLKWTHPRKEWRVPVPLDRLKRAEDARDRSNRLLVLIAGISLVVGGIGIMSIMLATVTEQTREIGIRRALGARRGDTTMQCVIEAVVQTGIGGLFGLGTMFGIPLLWGVFAEKPLPAQVQVSSIFLSLAVAVGVGVGFG